MRSELVAPHNRESALAAVLVFLAALMSVSCGIGAANVAGGSSGLTLNTSKVDFGDVSLGSSQKSVLTLTNSSPAGGAVVSFTQVTATGSGFTVSTAQLPITLTPGQTSSATITFTPKSAGVITGTLSITVTGDATPVQVALSGTGVGSAQLAVSPATLPFGSLAVGNSAVLSGRLTAGSSTITVSSGNISGQGYSLSGIAFPATVPAGTGISYSVTFTPQAPGSSPGSVTFVSNAANSPATQTFTGTGTQAAPVAAPLGNLAAAPATLAFGNVAVGSSKNMTGTLTAGSSDIAVSSASWSGPGYSVSGISFPVTIPAGTSISYTVTFAPQAAGSATGGISFASNAANAPAIQAFSGTGTQAAAPAVQHSVNLSWGASTSTVIGYNVYRGTVSGGPYGKLNSTPQAATTYSDSTVQSGTTYYYVVTAVDDNSVESAYSNQATAVVPSP